MPGILWVRIVAAQAGLQPRASGHVPPARMSAPAGGYLRAHCRPHKRMHGTIQRSRAFSSNHMGQGVSLPHRKRQGAALLSACRSGSFQLADEASGGPGGGSC